MTHVLGFAAFLLLPIVGAGAMRLKGVREMPFGGKVAVAGAAGAGIVVAVMAAMSILGIDWSRGRLFTILAPIAAINVYIGRIPIGRVRPRLGIIAFALLTTYGLLTARQTCSDLQSIWGPKAVRFYRDGGVHVASLADSVVERMGPGYPLMLPLLYAWSTTVSSQISWWAALLASGLFLFASVALILGATNDRDGALLIAATLSWCCADSNATGGAEPALLFFETLAIIAVVFLDSTPLAMLGLAGAVMLQIEGETFAIAFVGAALIARKSLRQTLLMAAPAALLLAGWVIFLNANGLSEFYRGAGMPIYLTALPTTLKITAKAAAYDLWGLPWIAAAAVLLLGRNQRASIFPLAVAALTLAATIFFYIHARDPSWWIANSAQRVLLTPLTASLIAAVAANRNATSLRADT